MEKLTGKRKHTVKAGNYPHTNMISKQATMRRGERKCQKEELHLKLRNQQLKTTLYIDKLLYQNLMGNTNQKTIIDTHTKRKSKPNITLNMVIKQQENRIKKKE